MQFRKTVVERDVVGGHCRVRRLSVVESEFCPDAAGVFPDNEVVFLDAQRLPDDVVVFRKQKTPRASEPARRSTYAAAAASTSASVRSSPSHFDTTAVAMLLPITFVAERPISRK